MRNDELHILYFNIDFQKNITEAGEKEKKTSAIFFFFICTQLDRWALIILSLDPTTTTNTSYRPSIHAAIHMHTHFCFSFNYEKDIFNYSV